MDKKYQLLKIETCQLSDSRVLYRIQAIKGFANVRTSDWGDIEKFQC